VSDNDDYAPALDMGTTEQHDDAAATTHHARQDTSDAPPPPKGDNPNTPPPEPRAEAKGRDKMRAMFRDLSAKVRAGEVSIDTGSDLEPAIHGEPPEKPTPAPAPVVAAPVPATASPAAIAAAAIAAPPTAPVQRAAPMPDVAKAAETQRALLLDMRQKEIEAREAKLLEREKTAAARPSPEKLLDNPLPTLEQYIREAWGLTDEAEIKDTITDLMTEMAEKYHGVKIPDDVRSRVDSRKALRTVKATKAEIARERAELAAKAEAQAKADAEAREKHEAAHYETRAVAQLTGLIEANQASFPYLAVQDNHAAIVWEVLKERHNRGESTNWNEAAKLADDHFKADHERTQAELAKRASRLSTLLAPVAAPAPAKPAVSPGGAPGSAPTQPATAAQPQQPTPAPTLQDPSDTVGEDRRDARARSLRKLIAKHGLGANGAQ
jgi:hypothetical protein